MSVFKLRFGWSVAVAAALLIATSSTSYAGPIYGFTVVENNSPIDVGPQLTVEVNAAGPGQVLFTFRNSGPLASSITDIYFDDGELLSIAAVIDSPGVEFSEGASPRNLPGGSAINFRTTKGFLADSDSPVQTSGVNPGERVDILFNLQTGSTFDDVLGALALSLANPGRDVTGGLRIGIHVQGLPDEDSESYVNGGTVPGVGPPPSPIPEPASLAVWGLGLGAMALVGARRRAKKA